MELKKILTILIIFLILVGGVLYFYYYYEEPIAFNESNLEKINIMAFEGNTPIETGYKIYLDGGFYKEGKTSRIGAIQELLPRNHTFAVESFNLENQRHYTYLTQNYVIYNGTIYRVEMNPKPFGVLNVSVVKGFFGIDENLTISLYSYGISKDLLLCFKWSYNILNLNIENATLLTNEEKPEKYKYYDKCFDLNLTLENQQKIIILNYELFSQISPDDYINISIIDRDATFAGKISEIMGKDVGEPNINFLIKV